MLDLSKTEVIQVIWDEIYKLPPEEQKKEAKKVEKTQPVIVKFIHEELESTGVTYSDQYLLWVTLCLKVVMESSDLKKVPKLKLDELCEMIERNEEEFGFDDLDEIHENNRNVLLEHVLDLIQNVDLSDEKEATDEFQPNEEGNEDEDEIEALNNMEHAEYNDYEMEEEEGDEDDIMFREMYNEHEDKGDENLTEEEETIYTLFLIFKSIIDVLASKAR